MRQKELVSASRVAILEQLSASLGEINQPISALVLNAEAALQLLRAQPTNTGAVRRLLACIVKDALRAGDILRRTRALIEKAPSPSVDRTPVSLSLAPLAQAFASHMAPVLANSREPTASWVPRAPPGRSPKLSPPSDTAGRATAAPTSRRSRR
jgi:C4-dicarboxylate-specific signal transduction histidine kinase